MKPRRESRKRPSDQAKRSDEAHERPGAGRPQGILWNPFEKAEI